MFLRQPAIGDVPRHADQRHRCTGVVSHHGGPKFHREFAPVLSAVQQFAVPSSLQSGGEDSIRNLRRHAGRSYHGYILSHQLPCCVSVRFAKGVIDKEEFVLQIGNGDAVARRRDRLCHQRELPLRVLSLRNVLFDSNKMGDLIIRILQGSDRHVHRVQAAVFLLVDELASPHIPLSDCVPQSSIIRIFLHP